MEQEFGIASGVRDDCARHDEGQEVVEGDLRAPMELDGEVMEPALAVKSDVDRPLGIGVRADGVVNQPVRIAGRFRWAIASVDLLTQGDDVPIRDPPEMEGEVPGHEDAVGWREAVQNLCVLDAGVFAAGLVPASGEDQDELGDQGGSERE